MATQAYFSATGETLGLALENATVSVHIVLAGCCERSLFEHLLRCRRRGVQVELALRDASLNQQSSLAWERLSAAGAVLHWLQPQGCIGWPHSLCLVDASSVISGTWQSGPQLGAPCCIVVETETTTQTETQWLEQYQALFATLKAQTSTREPLPPSLEPSGTALQVSAANAPSTELSAWELHIWQLHALAWEAELAEIQRQMALFDAHQEHRIGELLRSFLDHKRRYLEHLHQLRQDETTAYEARTANQAYDDYQQSRAAQASEFAENAGSTDPQQQADIKQLYRKLAMQCHPDRVLDAHKVQALALFQQVRQSYQRSDLAQLQQLQSVLQTRNIFESLADRPAKPADAAPSSNALLMAMQNAIAQQQQERSALMQSATWRTLSTQPNWPVWFAQQAEQLQNEIQRYADALGQHPPGAENSAERPAFTDQCA